jgi:hypothetical protein
MPQVSVNYGRMVRVPPALVLQIEAVDEDSQYSEMSFGFIPTTCLEGNNTLLLVPRPMIKLPDASRGFVVSPGQRRWELALQMN